MRSHAEYRRPRRLSSKLRLVGSILQVTAIAAATFILLPLVVQAVPGSNPIFVEPGGTRKFQCEFTGQEAFPGDTVFCKLRVGNGGDIDASYYMYADETSIRVLDAKDLEVTNTDLKQRFISLWFFHMFTRPVITRSTPEERDVTYDAQYAEICPQKLLQSYDGGPNPSNMSWDRMCPMGTIRGISSPRRYTELSEPAYERQYLLAMTERDDGTDQSVFKGWGLEFDLIVRTKVPGDDTCPTTRVNGICGLPVYQRP